MPSPVAARRIALLAAARATGGALVRFDAARLRFSLGTSIADVRVPLQVTPDAAAIVSGAAAELAMLLATRHRHFVPCDELDRVILADGYATLPTPERTLGPSGGGADVRAAAELGVAAHPALTGGVLCAWMGKGGRGRSLTALFIEALGRAFAEMQGSPEGEETPVIVALALHGELAAADERVRALLPAPPVGHYLRTATFSGLWVAARTGLARAGRATGRAADDPVLAKLEAVLSPAPLIAAVGAPPLGSTFYGCELAAGVPRADELASRLAAGADPQAALRDLARALAADGEGARRAEAAVAVARLRADLGQGLAAAEASGGGAALDALRDLFTAPGALAAACADGQARRDLAQRALDAALAAGGAAAGPLERAARALGGWRPLEPAASAGLDRAAALSEYAHAGGALLCDVALERLAAPARRGLLRRTGAEAEGGAEAEWQAGRLYRVSARAGPILRRAEERPLAHLFADVKDFTRRTGLLGTAAMAEFLRSEFYQPILAAAKERFAGMPELADRGGVAVNNLVGDAISFSGAIEALVALAADIRRLLVAYEARLAREVSSHAVARQLREIEARAAAEAVEARAALELARAARAAAAPGSPEALEAARREERLVEAEARLGAERERALARARGEGLEAGVFLSYGAPPVTVLLDDEVFGQQRVAIADKINESARGTARSPAARARADARLAAERVARGSPALAHAWRVFVERPLSLELPPDAERAALTAARAGDLAAALRAVAPPVREALERAAREGESEAGEIYTAGAAVSEEALEAFLFAVAPERSLRRFQLEPGEIPEALRARWFFGDAPLELVATFRADGRAAELFRRAGVASFKGLGDVPVWELAADAGAPAALLQHFAAEWSR
jgi:hypothetical protein